MEGGRKESGELEAQLVLAAGFVTAMSARKKVGDGEKKRARELGL